MKEPIGGRESSAAIAGILAAVGPCLWQPRVAEQRRSIAAALLGWVGDRSQSRLASATR